jgi:hypothetical protein
MLCEGKIGCHDCLNFLAILEARLAKAEEAERLAKEEREETLRVIQAFKKGG